MKTILALILSALTLSAATVTNPPASVWVTWDPSPDASVRGYYVWTATNSLALATNFVKTPAGTNCVATVTNMVRGKTYFFVVTATNQSGLESDFSNEVQYTVPSPPPPPTLRVIVQLTFQRAEGPSGPWTDEVKFPAYAFLPADDAHYFYRGVMDIQTKTE